MKIAVVQMRSGADPWVNLSVVQDFIQDAERQGCELICFPENVFYRGPRSPQTFKRDEIFFEREANNSLKVNSQFSKALKELFQGLKIPVSLGSVLERNPENDLLPFNAHWVVVPAVKGSSEHIHCYKKVHLFDFSSPVATYKESKDIAPGADTGPVNIGGFRFGLSICYDLRFPEFYRYMTLKQGVDVLLVPAAFTRETGEAHWHALLKARAIENLSYALAPAQWGLHFNNEGKALYCYGHALAYDPWGELLVDAGSEGDNLLVVDISKERISQLRGHLPALENAKFFHSIVGHS